jgi:prophage regulatory protein
MERQMNQNPLRALRRPEVLAKTGISTSTLYDLMARHEFPKPIRLGANSVAWVEREVDNWLATRIAARDSEAAAA